MNRFEIQNGVGKFPYAYPLSQSVLQNESAKCHIWVSEVCHQLSGTEANVVQDPFTASFTTCILPTVSLVPVGIAVCIILGIVLSLLPIGSVLPKWSRNFIQEPKGEEGEATGSEKRQFGRLSILLLVASTIGLALQVVSIFFPIFRMDMMIYLTISWALATLLICITRPDTAPMALLLLYISILIAHSIILFSAVIDLTPETIPFILVLVAAIGAIAIILNMPLRQTSMPSDKISPAFSPPTSALRSPEDNLTMWQYMTVSWMAPLIRLGRERQLNDEDVWDLGYEFQHRLLHDNFRELKGTVLSRLIQANAIDLGIISILAIIELFASKEVTQGKAKWITNYAHRLFRAYFPTKDLTVDGRSSFP
jgi:hypothetical protein